MNKNEKNAWFFSGKVFYLKKLDNKYGASLKLKGEVFDGFNARLCEISCLLTKQAWEEGIKKGVAMYKHVALSGHMETFVKNERQKTMFIADYILEVA